jgi:hypothetical protein
MPSWLAPDLFNGLSNYSPGFKTHPPGLADYRALRNIHALADLTGTEFSVPESA